MHIDRLLLWGAILLPLPIYSYEASSEDQWAKNIFAHIEIRDPHSASTEAEQALARYPHSKILYEAWLYALSKEGNEKKMGAVWQQYRSLFPEDPYNREVMEAMAWGTLHASSRSSSPLVRLLAVLGAFYGQDAEGVEILAGSMKDSSSPVRSAAVQFSSHLRDARLAQEVLRLLKEEKNWKVRLEAINAAGEMKLAQACPLLVEWLDNDLKSQEEKGAAIKALVKIYDKIGSNELQQLVKSPRANLRALACQIIENQDLPGCEGSLFSLMKDCHPEVRAAALHSIGILGCLEKDAANGKRLCFECFQDPDPQVAITAAWLLLPAYPERASEIFKKFVLGHDEDMALLAAGALSATGTRGVDLMYSLFKQSANPFVKLNLAIGLIQQGRHRQECCRCLYQSIMAHQEKWMTDESGFFKIILPSTVSHDELIPNYPEAVNQMTRLEVLNILAILKFPQAQEAIRHCLQQKTIGISGVASSVLLTEGDENAIALVENLLEDPDPKISLQAALVLAQWGGGDKALNTLYKAYNTSDRSVKEKILEGLATIGEASAIPFLVEKLREPYPSLRIIAAVALLACMNH